MVGDISGGLQLYPPFVALIRIQLRDISRLLSLDLPSAAKGAIAKHHAGAN